MPTVMQIEGYRFFFVSMDRDEPPHIHIKREKMVAKIWLDPVVLERTGGFSRVEINKIIKMVLSHREYLLDKWNEFFER